MKMTDIYSAAKEWLYSGGDDLVPLSFEESTDQELAAQFIDAYRTNVGEPCPYSLADLTAVYADLREEG